MSNYKSKSISKCDVEEITGPELGQILERLQMEVNRYDQLSYEISCEVQVIKKFESDLGNDDIHKDKQPESVTEELRMLIARFNVINDKCEINLIH